VGWSLKRHQNTDARSLNRPILKLQGRHAFKLSQVVADQGQALASRMGGDVQVVYTEVQTDGLALFLQPGANGSVVLRRFNAIGQHVQSIAQIFHNGQVGGLTHSSGFEN
jgi:hypothetical protein